MPHHWPPPSYKSLKKYYKAYIHHNIVAKERLWLIQMIVNNLAHLEIMYVMNYISDHSLRSSSQL